MLYGLKADTQGVLHAAEVDTANAAVPAAAVQKKLKPAFLSILAPSGTSAVPAIGLGNTNNVEVCSVSLAHLYGHCLLPTAIS